MPNVPFALIGGIAVTFRGEPRFTADIDATVGIGILKTGGELQSAIDQDLLSVLRSMREEGQGG